MSADDNLVDMFSAKIKRRMTEMSKDDNKSAVIIACIKDMGVTLNYNAFTDQHFLTGLNREGCDAEWDGQLNDAAVLEVRARLDEIKPRFCPATGRLREIICTEAVRNSFHPVRDYLNSLKWDNVSRSESLFPQYFGCEDTPYTRAVGRLFLVAGAARVFDPGCKYDFVVTLIGDQGLGKSTGVQALCPNPRWFSDQFPAISMSSHPGRDCQEHFRGRWIIEWGEMAGLRKSEAEQVKSLLSRQTDRGRPAYAHFTMDIDRQCVIVATTNDQDCLHDQTGNRRFLPITCQAEIFVEALKQDRDQLWAEAVALYNAGERPVLDPALYAVAAEQQQAHMDAGPIGEYLERAKDIEKGIISAKIVHDYIKSRVQNWDEDKGPRAVSKAMAAAGWKRDRYGPRDDRLKRMTRIFAKGQAGVESHKSLSIISIRDICSDQDCLI